ncbi:MAG: hypothetical protein HOP29_08195 [Phycisphaerales bacterium]|nr:hypothetical protein [Phycisphaerales bacterium]
MPRKKSFDCVEMKREIQESLPQDYPGLPPEEQYRQIVRDLNAADDPIAAKWSALLRSGDRHETGE